MKRMRKWKQAITVLLSVAMLVTAVPQTGAVALAAGENEILEDAGMPAVVQDDLEQDKDGNTDNGDTTVSSGEENSSTGDKSEESDGEDEAGEGSEDQDVTDSNNGDDEESPENPDGEENNEEGTTEDGESEDSDEDGEGVDEEGTIEEQTEEESVSMNTLTAEPAAAEVMADAPEYKGSVSGDFIQIDVGCVIIESSESSRIDGIVKILEYYAKQGKKFHGIYISSLSCDPNLSQDGKVIISSKIVNAAVDAWAGEYGYVEFADNQSDMRISYCFTMPHTIDQDITIENVTTLLPKQGMQMKLSVNTTDIPGESLQIRWSKEEEGFYDYFGQEECDLSLLSMETGTPTGIIQNSSGMYTEFTWSDSEGNNGTGRDVVVNIDDFDELKSGAEYLITPLYDDASIYKETTVQVGGTRQLKAGYRTDYKEVSDAKWTSWNPEVVTIDGNGLLSAVSVGEAYYCETYTYNDDQCLELHKVKTAVTSSGGTTLEYIGEVTEEGGEYSLDINTYLKSKWRWMSNNEIEAILNYYKEQGEKFDHISISNMYAADGQYAWIPKQVVNAARKVLKDDGTLTYGFEITNATLSFTLTSPEEFSSDVKFNYSERLIENQGLKIKFADSNISIPAEFVTCDILWNPEHSAKLKYEIADWDDDSDPHQANYGMFKLSSGLPSAWIRYEADKLMGEEADGSIRFMVGGLNDIQLNAEYLIMPIYYFPLDEEGRYSDIPMGKQIQLTAGERCGKEIASATWKSLSPEVVTIDKNGLLTAWDKEDCAMYYAKYNADGKAYLEMYVSSVVKPPVQIAFDEDNIELNENDEKYLRLRFYPSDAECDPGNPDEITWESSAPNVVSLVKYNTSGAEDEFGNPNGTIKAVREGTATITAYYMVNQEDENGDVVTDEEGKPIKVKGDAVAECTVTVTKPLTYEDVKDKIDSMNLYAVTNLDTKLSDIALKDGWTWKYPDTALANFKDMDGHTFAAVYTDPSGKTITWNLWVRMVTVTGVTISYKNEEAQESEPEWSEDVPVSMEAGNSITLGYGYIVENLAGETEEEYEAEYEKVRQRMDERYSIEWTSNPKNLGSVEDNEYKYDASVTGKKAEKKTFTVSMKDKATNKVLFKASRTITVTVNPTYDFGCIESVDVHTDPTGQMWLQLQINMAKEDYLQQKLTVASEDSAILKLDTKKTIVADPLGESEDPKTFVTIPCTNPKPGIAWIKVTAPDEMKSVQRYSIEFIDKEPKLIDTTAVSINRAMEDKTATVTVRTRKDCPLASDADISLKLNKRDTASIKAEIVDRAEEDAEHCDYTIKLSLTEQATADRNLKKGKNTVAMTLTVDPDDAEPEQYTLNLTLNVTDSVPKVSFKQTKNVNLFYNDEEGYGVLNVDANGAVIQNLTLIDYTDGKNPKKDAQCDFELVDRDGTYYIALKDSGNAKNTKGLLTYDLEGYPGHYWITFTVKTETKKPVIVLSAKSEVLYPNAGYTDSWLTMLDKATGECIELDVNDEAQYVANKKKGLCTALNVANFDLENPEKEVRITANNAYNLLVTPDGNIVSRLQSIENQSYSKKADKFNLEIKKDNWTDWVAVSYSLTVNTANPKLVLGASTLKLNKNSEVYKAQMARTSLRLKGYVDYVMQDEWSWVSITGQDEKSKKALKVDNSLVVQYWGDCGDIIVKFNNNKIEKGKYKFNISVGNEDAGTIASTTLTVEVIDTAMDKNLKVSAKGAIDVLDREGTSIAYTPKLSNLSGEIVDGWLEGKDSALFRAEFDNGRLFVHAEGNDTDLSTKNTYQVDAVFLVETQDYDCYEVRTTKPLSIKVKQGKPKLTASTSSNTLYRQLDNTVEIRLDAVLNKKEVEIEDVWLLNYTEDLQLVSKQLTDEEGHDYEGIYDPRTKSVTLALSDRYYADTILQSGKTWKVKLAVRYRDKAGNEKNAEVTCPVVVR